MLGSHLKIALVVLLGLQLAESIRPAANEAVASVVPPTKTEPPAAEETSQSVRHETSRDSFAFVESLMDTREDIPKLASLIQTVFKAESMIDENKGPKDKKGILKKYFNDLKNAKTGTNPGDLPPGFKFKPLNLKHPENEPMEPTAITTPLSQATHEEIVTHLMSLTDKERKAIVDALKMSVKEAKLAAKARIRELKKAIRAHAKSCRELRKKAKKTRDWDEYDATCQDQKLDPTPADEWWKSEDSGTLQGQAGEPEKWDFNSYGDANLPYNPRPVNDRHSPGNVDDERLSFSNLYKLADAHEESANKFGKAMAGGDDSLSAKADLAIKEAKKANYLADHMVRAMNRLNEERVEWYNLEKTRRAEELADFLHISDVDMPYDVVHDFAPTQEATVEQLVAKGKDDSIDVDLKSKKGSRDSLAASAKSEGGDS